MRKSSDTPSISDRLESYAYALVLTGLILGFATAMLVAKACGWGEPPR